MSDDAKKATPMTTYYVEANNKFVRLNVPKDWDVSCEINSGAGYQTFVVSEKGQVKYMVPYVTGIRTSSLNAQEAEAILDENNAMTGVSWVDLDPSETQNSQTRQQLRSRAVRRARAEGGNNNGPLAGEAYMEPDYYEGEEH